MKIGTLCYIKKNNKTLMLHRVKKENDMHKNKWNGLGGKLIPGESPEECVIREIKEESGLNIKTPSLKGIITFPKFDNIEDWLVFVFTANQYSMGYLIFCIFLVFYVRLLIFGGDPSIGMPKGYYQSNHVLSQKLIVLTILIATLHQTLGIRKFLNDKEINY